MVGVGTSILVNGISLIDRRGLLGYAVTPWP